MKGDHRPGWDLDAVWPRAGRLSLPYLLVRRLVTAAVYGPFSWGCSAWLLAYVFSGVIIISFLET